MTLALRKPATGPITSPYGPRPIYGFHNGIDFGFLEAAPDYRIFAAAAGTVVQVTVTTTMGRYTMIDHGNGYKTAYAHQSAQLVKVGQKVTAGEHIGTMGHTGSLAAGTHLHFELWHNGVRVDPAPYLAAPAGGGTPIREESEINMSDGISYLYKPKDKTPVAYGVFGAEIPGGSYVTSSVAEAEALGAMYGTRALDADGQELRVGAPWKAMTETQWPVLISTAKKLADARETQSVRVLAAAMQGLPTAESPAPVTYNITAVATPAA